MGERAGASSSAVSSGFMHLRDDHSVGEKAKKQRAKRSMEERLEAIKRQRDQAQSILASANMRIVELTEQVQSLQRVLDELQPPPTRLSR